MVRKLCCCFAGTFCKKMDAREKKLLLTKLASKQLSFLRTWPWAKVLAWANIWAFLMGWGTVYCTTLTYMALSYIIAALWSLEWWLVAIMFYGIGLVMFLIPTVPGPAVYLTCGLLLVPICQAQWTALGWTEGLLYPCVFASAQCYTMKLAAHVLQQKIFGEALANSKIRAMVGINSTTSKVSGDDESRG